MLAVPSRVLRSTAIAIKQPYMNMYIGATAPQDSDADTESTHACALRLSACEWAGAHRWLRECGLRGRGRAAFEAAVNIKAKPAGSSGTIPSKDPRIKLS